MRKRSLGIYVVGVIIAIILVNCIVWFINKPELPNVIIFSSGYLLGMLAMYIAVHLYKWK